MHRTTRYHWTTAFEGPLGHTDLRGRSVAAAFVVTYRDAPQQGEAPTAVITLATKQFQPEAEHVAGGIDAKKLEPPGPPAPVEIWAT